MGRLAAPPRVVSWLLLPRAVGLLRTSSKETSKVLEVANLEVVYNDVILVLRGLSINVGDGQIVALLGANGAGKTTTVRAIGGLLDVHEGDITKGTITFNGADITHAKPSHIVEAGITQVMEGRRVFAELTVDENLMTGGFTVKDKAANEASYARVMDLFPRLAERRKQTAGYLSGGEQQMLAIGRALMADPKLLILDEPSSVRPDAHRTDSRHHRRHQQAGCQRPAREQNAMMALSIAEVGYVMETGKVVMDGEAQKLLADEDVQEFYLGLHGDGGERKSFRDVKHYKRRKRWLS